MKAHTRLTSLILPAMALLFSTSGCDMMLDSAVDATPAYSVGVGTGGVSVNVGSSYWSPGWNSPFWTYPVYRPAYVPSRPVINPIPPTRPGGNFNPAPLPSLPGNNVRPTPSPLPPQGGGVNGVPTPPASGNRPGAH